MNQILNGKVIVTHKPKFLITRNHQKFIEIHIKKITSLFTFTTNDSELVLYIDGPINCLKPDIKKASTKIIQNFLVDFNQQLIRYWILKPCIFLKFESNKKMSQFLNVVIFGENGIQYEIFNNQQKSKLYKKKILSLTLSPLIIDKSDGMVLLKSHEVLFLKSLSGLPDEVRFLIFALISSRILIRPIDIPQNFLFFLHEICKGLNKEVMRRLVITFTQVIHGRSVENSNLLSVFKKNYFAKRTNYYNYHLYDIQHRIKKVYVTPNQIYFSCFENEDSNRVLSLYKNKINNFIRVTFSDDKFCKMFFCYDKFKEIATEVVVKILTEGLIIVDNKYEFLGYSNSQLRSHSIWMIQEDHQLSFDSVYSSFGDFNPEKNISKNASRRGLCFTTAKYFKEIPNIQVIDDVVVTLNDENDFCITFPRGTCTNKEYNFTDGIGKISLNLAKGCASLFKKSFASAFQIRLAGAKGVLAVDPELPDDTVCLRKSMIKFSSDLKDLNVIRISNVSPGYLNRQIIMLLSFLKIPNEVFISLQDTHLSILDRIRNLEIASNELNCLRSSNFLKQFLAHVSRLQQSSQLIPTKEKLVKDPFIFGISTVVYLNSLQLLKNKAKIFVEDSGKFLGVIDENGILGPGEVFLRIGKSNEDDLNETSVITIEGPVIVTRNPCMFPGDIRVCKAINDPRLNHYINVLVFPMKGLIPLQTLLSEGDLDGDIYFVSWDKRLIPNMPFNTIFTLDAYKASQGNKFELKVEPDFVVKDVKKTDIVSFFVKYLINDIVGALSNRHLALCDKFTPIHTPCLDLCIYDSYALNFGKYGETISFDLLNSSSYKVNSWPDFMEKPHSYASKKILGILYRTIKDVYKQFTDNTHPLKAHYEVDNAIYSQGFEAFLGISKAFLYDYYIEEMKYYLNKYKLKNEFEFLSAIILHYKKNKFGKDDFDIRESISQDCEALIQSYQYYCNIVLLNFFNCISADYGKDANWSYLITNCLNFQVIEFYQSKIETQFSYYEIFDSEYSKLLKKEISELSNNSLFTSIQKALISACHFVSYAAHIKQDEELTVNNDILFREMIDKYKINIKSLQMQYAYMELIEDVFNDEYDYEYEYDYDPYEKKFYSLPWILDYKQILAMQKHKLNQFQTQMEEMSLHDDNLSSEIYDK